MIPSILRQIFATHSLFGSPTYRYHGQCRQLDESDRKMSPFWYLEYFCLLWGLWGSPTYRYGGKKEDVPILRIFLEEDLCQGVRLIDLTDIPEGADTLNIF